MNSSGKGHDDDDDEEENELAEPLLLNTIGQKNGTTRPGISDVDPTRIETTTNTKMADVLYNPITDVATAEAASASSSITDNSASMLEEDDNNEEGNDGSNNYYHTLEKLLRRRAGGSSNSKIANKMQPLTLEQQKATTTTTTTTEDNIKIIHQYVPPTTSSNGNGSIDDEEMITEALMPPGSSSTNNNNPQIPIPQENYYYPVQHYEEQFVIPPRTKRTLSTLKTRWFILLLTCLIMTGNYYSYDTPAALHQQLKDDMITVSISSNNDNDNNSNNNKKFHDDFEFKFNLLYTVYSIPNILLPLYSGTISDQFGYAKCTTIFATLTLIGQIIFTTGAFVRNWHLMLLGRTIYGLGGESITVSSSSMLASWFAGGEVALALGVNLAISRMGSVLNNFISPKVANRESTDHGPSLALALGAGMNLLSLICAVGVMTIDRRCRTKLHNEEKARSLLTASLLEEDYHNQINNHSNNYNLNLRQASRNSFEEPQYHRLHPRHFPLGMLDHDSFDDNDGDSLDFYNREDGDNNDDDDDITETIEPPVRLRDMKHFGIMFWLVSLSCVVVYGCVLPFNNIASGVLLERNYFKQVPPAPECILWYPDQCTSGTLATKLNPSRYSDNTPCPGPYYAPVLPRTLNITTKADPSWFYDHYVYKEHTKTELTPYDVDCMDPFWSQACTKDYCDAQDNATEIAGKRMSIPYFLSAALSPFLGYLVDVIGHRATMTILAPLILLGVHTTLAWGTGSPVIPFIFQGIAYSLFAAVIWPSVPLTIPSSPYSNRYVGTAYGAMTSFQNFGLAIFPLFIASIYDHTGSFIPSTEVFFITLAIVGLFLGGTLHYFDQRTGGYLNAVHYQNSTFSKSNNSNIINGTQYHAAANEDFFNDGSVERRRHTPRPPSFMFRSSDLI